jgi:hypothetical protein
MCQINHGPAHAVILIEYVYIEIAQVHYEKRDEEAVVGKSQSRQYMIGKSAMSIFNIFYKK